MRKNHSAISIYISKLQEQLFFTTDNSILLIGNLQRKVLITIRRRIPITPCIITVWNWWCCQLCFLFGGKLSLAPALRFASVLFCVCNVAFGRGFPQGVVISESKLFFRPFGELRFARIEWILKTKSARNIRLIDLTPTWSGWMLSDNWNIVLTPGFTQGGTAASFILITAAIYNVCNFE